MSCIEEAVGGKTKKKSSLYRNAMHHNKSDHFALKEMKSVETLSYACLMHQNRKRLDFV